MARLNLTRRSDLRSNLQKLFFQRLQFGNLTVPRTKEAALQRTYGRRATHETHTFRLAIHPKPCTIIEECQINLAKLAREGSQLGFKFSFKANVQGTVDGKREDSLHSV